MSQCKVCSFGNRGALENALCRGTSYRTLARKYGLSAAGIGRHNRSHLPAALRDRISARRLGGVEQSLAELKRDEGDNLLRLLVAQRGRLGDLADRARMKNNFLGEAAAEKHVLANLTVTARLLGELSTGGSTTTVNQLVVSASYVKLRAALLQALTGDEFSNARARVSAALRSVETELDEPMPALAIAGPTQ
jgi:hypothetical protein